MTERPFEEEQRDTMIQKKKMNIRHGPISLVLDPLDGASYWQERDSNPRQSWTLRKVWLSWLKRRAGAT